MPLTRLSRIISLVLALSIGGRLLMGWLADHLSRKRVMLLIYLLVAAAGPASNLVLALVGAVALRLVAAAAPASADLRIVGPVATILYALLVVNLLLAIFNMLPIPPLDGGTVLSGLLPERLAAGFDRLRPYGFVLLYVLMFSGGFSRVVGIPYRYILSWLI